LCLELGFIHPDVMLAQMTSKQLTEWLAISTMEIIGEQTPPDPEEVARQKQAAQRAKLEGGLRALRDKRG